MADISELSDEELVPKKGSFLEWIGMNVSRSKFTKLANTTDCEKNASHARKRAIKELLIKRRIA